MRLSLKACVLYHFRIVTTLQSLQVSASGDTLTTLATYRGAPWQPSRDPSNRCQSLPFSQFPGPLSRRPDPQERNLHRTCARTLRRLAPKPPSMDSRVLPSRYREALFNISFSFLGPNCSTKRPLPDFWRACQAIESYPFQEKPSPH